MTRNISALLDRPIQLVAVGLLWVATPLLGEAAAEPALSGVVVEEVGEGSALAKAGLEPGDVLVAWRRLPQPPANPEEARGKIDSAFDWMWLVVEQAPRGTVELSGRRDGEQRVFTVAPGVWEAEVRPRMPPVLLRDYRQGQKHLETGEITEAAGWWEKVAAAPSVNRLSCWIWFRLGEVWAEHLQWAHAHAAYRSALKETRDLFSESLLWQNIGRAYEKQGELQLAHQAYSSARKKREKDQERESLVLAESLDRLAEVAFYRGALDLAESLFERALAIRQEQAPGSLSVAEGFNNLGVAAADRGDLDRAARLFLRALAITRKLAPDSHLVAYSLAGLGDVAKARGDLEEATGFLEHALEIWQRRAPESLDMAYSLNHLGIVAGERGELALATELFEHALEIRQKLAPDSPDSAYNFSYLGEVARRRGDLERATAFFERAQKIWQRLSPKSLDIAYSLTTLGLVAKQRGELERASSFLKRALEIRQELAPDSLPVAQCLAHLGEVARLHGDLGEATDRFERALEIRQKLAPGSLALAASLYYLGTVADNRGDSDQAVDFYKHALEIRQQLAPNSIEVAETLYALGRMSRQRTPAQLGATDHLFCRALDTLESQLARLGGSHDVRGGFRARYHELYHAALEVQLELEQWGTAFHTLERSRARSFLEQLNERNTLFTADIPEELDRQRRSLDVRFDRTQRKLAQLNPRDHSAQIENLHEQLHQLRAESGDLEERIRRASPRFAALQYPQPLDLESARSALDPGTVMLSFGVGKEQTNLFVVTREAGLRVHSIPIGAEPLKRQVELLRERIEQPPWRHRRTSFMEVSRDLYRALIEPVGDLIENSERVLIVPDGPLHLLPFGALIRSSADTAGDPLPEDRYLAEWKPLHSVLSATVYAELKKSRRQGQPRSGKAPVLLAAFGDPQYPPRLRQAELEGREQGPPRASLEPIADVRVRAAVEHGLFDWQPLPSTRWEIEEIARLYPEGARAYLGAAATEERAKSIGPGTRILHFAAHGHVDDRFPLNSAVALTIPEDWTEGRDNGLLQVWEIFERVRLDADLVVLSACATALGQEQGGDGLIGLTRAFQYAGARTVAASLWNVADATTAALMVRFYRHLRAGKPKDEALQAAQIELIRGPIEIRDDAGKMVEIDASAPYYWAAFQIFGDWR